jgi:hypothetical protein
MRRTTLLIIFCLSTLIFLTGCATQEQTTSAPWVITAAMYSGRPNPEGRLSAERADELLAKVAALPSGPAGAMGGLDYSGFTMLPVQSGSGDILSILVYDGMVAVARSNGTQYYRDTNREVERWLLETADEDDWLSDDEVQRIQEHLDNNS